ncbi:MAG: hypothetical protein M0Z37_05345 [Nitrospiraceae bacterium]|jgi:hypothetical protein|nr:hypothetical protein [Nitrospiraceae bacterium]
MGKLRIEDGRPLGDDLPSAEIELEEISLGSDTSMLLGRIEQGEIRFKSAHEIQRPLFCCY